MTKEPTQQAKYAEPLVFELEPTKYQKYHKPTTISRISIITTLSSFSSNDFLC